MKFQAKIKLEMERKGWHVINLIVLGLAGYPDLLCVKDGKCLFIECKEGNDTLKPLQKQKIDLLIKFGADAYCIHKDKGIIYPITQTL